MKINDAMTVDWEVDFSSDGNQDDEGNALAVDDNGNVYVGGFKDSTGQGTDFVTLMYDGGGGLAWAAMWNDTADGGDTVKAIAVDGNGNVTVTGSAWNGHSQDYHTIQYDNSGNMVWEISYDDKRGYDDHPNDIAIDNEGAVVVAGQTYDPVEDVYSYATVRYVVREFVAPVDSDSVSTSLRWIVNRDQLTDTTDTNLVERVRFYSNQCYPNMYFMDDTVSYVFFQGVDTSDVDTLHRIDMTFNGNEGVAKLLPLEKEGYWNNYYLGHVPEGRPFVSLYERMYMQDVWPNIDVMYSSNQRGLKYYFIVHPSGEPGAISLQYHGYEDLYVDGNDALVIESSIGEVVQPQALAYEMDGNGELDLLGWQPVYDVDGGEVGFGDLNEWDGTLVIEVNWGYRTSGNAAPGWSTFYGGTGDDMAYDIVTTDDGDLYGGGETKSTDFPVRNASQPTFGGNVDAFVGGFDVDYKPKWMTYFGGTAEDRGYGVAHDFDHWVYLCGETGYPSSAGQLPIPHVSLTNTTNPYVNTYAGPTGFIARFDDVYGTIDWSTSFGGGSEGTCIEIECDHNGNAYLVGHNAFGYTTSTNTCTSTNNNVFPKCNLGSNSAVLQQTTHNSGHTRATDAFIAKFHNAQLKWSTLFGGYGDDYLSDVAIDHYYDRVYVVGQTGSIEDYIIAGPATTGSVAYMPICTLSTGYNQINLNGNNASINPSPTDGLIAQFDFEGVLQWSSFYGGSNNDNITSVAILPQSSNKTQANPAPGQILFSGVTATSTYGANCVVPSNNGFPACTTSSGQYQVTFQGGATDAFIALLDYDKDMLWSTYFGGTQSDDITYGTGLHSWPFQGPKVAIHSDGHKYLFGETQSGSNSTAAIPTDTELDLYYEDTHGDNTLGSNTDCFVTRFDASEDIDFSTYFGGGGAEYNGGIALYYDRVYICGGSSSISGFPLHDADGILTDAYFQDYNDIPGSTSATVSDAFFAQLRTSNNVVSIESPSGADANSFDALVYPNPTQATVTIEWEMEKPGKVLYSVVNLMGTTLLEKELQGGSGRNSERIDLRSQPSGIYILSLEINGNKFCRKIIVGK